MIIITIDAIVKAAFELQSLCVLERGSKNNWLYYILLLCFSNKGKSTSYGSNEISRCLSYLPEIV